MVISYKLYLNGRLDEVYVELRISVKELKIFFTYKESSEGAYRH